MFLTTHYMDKAEHADRLVMAHFVGTSRGQGGAPDWTSDLDAGEDRRRITGREGPGRSRNGVVSQAPIRASQPGGSA
jgi:hypothetical protein